VIPSGQLRHPELLPGKESPIQAIHQPGDDAPEADRVETGSVAVVVEPLGRALIEDPAERPQGLIGFVVLLEFPIHLLADRRAGFPAGGLLFGPDRFLVELLQVVIQDEPLVEPDPLLLGPADRPVVEGHDAAAHCRIIDAEGSPGIEFRIETVLGRSFEILHGELLTVFLYEPRIGHLAVSEILVEICPAVNDRGNPVLLKHLGAKSSATCPGVHEVRLSPGNRDRNDGAKIRGPRRRPDNQDARIVLITRGIPLVNVIEEAVDAAAARLPDRVCVDRIDFDLDLLPVASVQVEHGGNGSPADQTHHVDPEIVEDQPCAAHRGDEESTPARGKAGHEQPVRTGEDRSGKQSHADVEASCPAGDVETEINGAEIIADPVAFHPGKAGRRIDKENLLMFFHTSFLTGRFPGRHQPLPRSPVRAEPFGG